MTQDLYGQIFNSLTSGLIVLDREGAVVMANHAAASHLHLDDDVLTPGFRLFDLPRTSEMRLLFEEVLDCHEPLTRREVVLALDNGDKKEIGLACNPLHESNGVSGVIFLFTDMTERRRLERAAELNRQLASLGELTAGVVHELRNPLSVISGMSELVMRKLGPDHERYPALEAVMREAESMEKTISHFLGFARPYDVEPANCDPDEIVQRAVKLSTQRAHDKGVTLRVDTQADLPAMQADVGRAGQAIANIMNNGIDATGEGGEVCLRVFLDGADVVFEVCDDGPGICLAPGEDLFKPFFTQKEGGTGLGLAIVHRIVTAHGGSVAFANRDEGGAKFDIRLPLDKGCLRK